MIPLLEDNDMNYKDLEDIVSQDRLGRYRSSCANDEQRALNLYKLNEDLSMSFGPILSHFELALRNRIDLHYSAKQSDAEWLLHSVQPGGFLSHPSSSNTARLILDAHKELGVSYTHGKLVANLSFGCWRYFFGREQYKHGGYSLYQIFPRFTLSTTPSANPSPFWAELQAQDKLFKWLFEVNKLRNRIAHHEPICFDNAIQLSSAKYARERLYLILLLFEKLDISIEWIAPRVAHIEKLFARFY